MPANAAARRYAEAAFDLGREHHSLPQWDADLGIVRETLETDPRLMQLLTNPETPLPDKQRLVGRLFEGRVSPLTRNLLDLLLLRGRIAIAPQVQEAFGDLYLDFQGIAYADVTTAVSLDAAEEVRVVEQLTRLTGKQIRLRTHVDPDILGGFVARVGDQLIDATVATQLRQLKSRLHAAV